MISIEQNVPLPVNLRNLNNLKYPWADMQIGDSFFVPGITSAPIQSAKTYAQRKFGRVFTARSVKDGVRVWRIA